MKTEFKLNQNISICGTGFHNTTLVIEPSVLIKAFGDYKSDNYKSANEWIFLGQVKN